MDMSSPTRIDRVAGFLILGVLLLGCLIVLLPFVSTLLWAVVLSYSTWPIYSRLSQMLKGKKTLAATIMIMLLLATLVMPFVIAGSSLAEYAGPLIDKLKRIPSEGLPDLPPWIEKLPLAGERIERLWTDMGSDTTKVSAFLKPYLGRIADWLLTSGAAVGQAVFQLILSIIVCFFLYRDGAVAAEKLRNLVGRLAGKRGERLLNVASTTIKGVVYGIIGTAAAQAFLASIGFWICGVPGSILLGFLVFFLSMVPIGPPMVWLPVALWLFYTKSTAWGIFMLIWGTFVISGVDNVLKPYLISRGGELPFVLILIGVLGGIVAFGFIGVFIGPTLLALGYCLISEWASNRIEEEP
jgi:predicted PurR-regulated permease PerM